MPSVEPIKFYLEALEAHNRGDKETAAQKLAQSFGAKEPSSVINNSIDILLDGDAPANDVALRIISSEVSKRRDDGGER